MKLHKIIQFLDDPNHLIDYGSKQMAESVYNRCNIRSGIFYGCDFNNCYFENKNNVKLIDCNIVNEQFSEI